MRRIALFLVLAILALGAWEVIASVIFLIVGQIHDFPQPWAAWWLYAASGYGGYTTFLLVISAGLPAALAGLIAAGIWQRRHGAPSDNNRTLYGQTRWAMGSDLRDGGFRESKRPPR